MNRYVSKAVMATLLAGGLAAAVPVFAYGHYGHPGCGHKAHGAMGGGEGYSEIRIEHMAKRLDLTKDQLASVRSIVDKHRAQLRAVLDQLAENRSRLRAFAAESAPDEAKLRTTADRQGKAIADLIVIRTEMKAQINKVLTDDQRKKMRPMRRDW